MWMTAITRMSPFHSYPLLRNRRKLLDGSDQACYVRSSSLRKGICVKIGSGKLIVPHTSTNGTNDGDKQNDTNHPNTSGEARSTGLIPFQPMAVIGKTCGEMTDGQIKEERNNPKLEVRPMRCQKARTWTFGWLASRFPPWRPS
jgi:hypothetical protein